MEKKLFWSNVSLPKKPQFEIAGQGEAEMDYLETTVTVTEEQTAQSMGSGDLPVLATRP